LGAVLPAQAAVHPFESLRPALERLSASRRAHVLVFDTRAVAGLRNLIGHAYARLPGLAILLFARAAEVEGMRRVFKGSKIFAVLPIPVDSAKTALAFSAALTDARAKDLATPAPVASAPTVAPLASTPRNDRWGIGAGIALAVLACAGYLSIERPPAVPAASVRHSVPAAAEARPAPTGAAAPASAARAAEAQPEPASAAAPQAAGPEIAGAAPSAADQQAAQQTHLELTRYVVPDFPAAARARHVGGTVVVAYTVDTLGATRHVRVVSAEPAGIFNHDAVDAVRRWRYAPVMVGNAPTAVATHATIHFTPQ
jgi:protein TonB